MPDYADRAAMMEEELEKVRQQEAEKSLLYAGARDPSKLTPRRSFIQEHVGPELTEKEVLEQAAANVDKRIERGDVIVQERPTLDERRAKMQTAIAERADVKQEQERMKERTIRSRFFDHERL